MNQLKEEIQRLKDDINLDEQGQLLSSDGCVFLSKNVIYLILFVFFNVN